jgi:anti-sigma B factor antagonist
MPAMTWRVLDDIIVVNFTDTEIFDEARIQQVGKELMEIGAEAGKSESKKMLLNFRGVQFMSSAMIGKLVLLNKKAKGAGVVLRFCSISPNVLEVFKITRLDKLFKIMDDDDLGTAGSLARLIRPPDTDGGRAMPERPEGNDE